MRSQRLAGESLRFGDLFSGHLLPEPVSPLGWEPINLTGEYRWPSTDRRATRNA